MTNHPNRSKSGHRARNPKPSEVRAARERVQEDKGLGITEAQTYCAELVHSPIGSWQQWEADEKSSTNRRMHPAFWELFRIKAGIKNSDD